MAPFYDLVEVTFNSQPTPCDIWWQHGLKPELGKWDFPYWEYFNGTWPHTFTFAHGLQKGKFYHRLNTGPTDEGPFDLVNETGLLTPGWTETRIPPSLSFDANGDEDYLILTFDADYLQCLELLEYGITEEQGSPSEWWPITLPISPGDLYLSQHGWTQPYYVSLRHKFSLPGAYSLPYGDMADNIA